MSGYAPFFSETTVSDVAEERDLLQQRIDELEAENTLLATRLEGLDAENDDLRERLSEANFDADQAEYSNDQLRIIVDAASETLANRAAQVAFLERSLSLIDAYGGADLNVTGLVIAAALRGSNEVNEFVNAQVAELQKLDVVLDGPTDDDLASL
jgi:predicted nuclease with TOPRIM domain